MYVCINSGFRIEFEEGAFLSVFEAWYEPCKGHRCFKCLKRDDT